LQYHCTPLDDAWEGFQIADFKRTETKPSPTLSIYLKPANDHAPRCSRCGATCPNVHDRRMRVVRDLPILDAAVRLWVTVRRVSCPRCGVVPEQISWIERQQQVTRRLAESVSMLCRYTTIRATAQQYRLGWDQVKRIDKASLEKRLNPVNLEGIEYLLMDEFAIQKGHRYATVVLEPTRKRVLWVSRGRDKDSVRPFFELLGPRRCKAIKAVGMDMSAAYYEEVTKYCPNAHVVYDLFHVLARYGREVIDRVRVDQANKLRSSATERKLIKGSRWLLLRNRDNLKPEQEIQLRELLGCNQDLMITYVLKDDLKQLWSFTDIDEARQFWHGWRKRAVDSNLGPLIRFASNLDGKIQFILSHCLYPLGTNILEGVNNRIKVIKRMAYGFRDDQYFFLKIRGAFP